NSVAIEDNSFLNLNISMATASISLDMAVVTAGKFEQRLADVTVSMDIIQPEFLENNNTVNLETAVNQTPGVDVMDGQASVRGGGGYSYGAGSRVMILLDGLPMLTADVNEAKWNYLPVENIAQVEIMKGASSALYGSSALNGVINVRTMVPGKKPQTKVSLFGGMFMKPRRKETSWWWDANPLFGGASFSHLRKVGSVDLMFSGNGFSNTGYRMEDYEERIRFSAGFRHLPKKAKGLAYGLNASFQEQNSSDFLIWQDADSGAFLQNPDVISPTRGRRFNVDPYVLFYGEKGSKHSLRTRFYRVYNRFDDDPDKNNGSDLYYGEYQYQKTFTSGLNWTTGLIGSYAETNAELYGDHYSSTVGIYTQLDQKFFDRLSASLGLRWERYSLDKSKDASKPVLRAGVNYQAAEFTFIRASYGQGYRFPSIAETYTSTSLGSLNIFPNPDLNPETSWSTELGVRQGFKLGTWTGFVDAALFWNEYQDMIEFTFGIYHEDSTGIPGLDDIGFKSLNVGDARITGVDLLLGGSGYCRQVYLELFTGYTYMNPMEINAEDGEEQVLKYRYRHSVKGDIELTWKKLSGGMNLIYNSHIERIDEAFEEEILGQEIFPGLKDYRLKNNKGFVVFDFRAGYQITRASKLALIVKNLFNKEYMGRPGDIMPPRSITLQYNLGI
ncbi:MAG: TonB-dependent receptor, partial [Bacteroidota bacterium]|nr:TonB-dependent receptor [Bacteroidota bacterium]